MSSTAAEDLRSFGERLRELRRQRGLTQAELARMLPVSEGLISRWERAYRGQGRVWKPDRQAFLCLMQIFAESLDADEVEFLSQLVGYRLTQAELQALVPAAKLPASNRSHAAGAGRRVISSGAPTVFPAGADHEPFVVREEEMARLHKHLFAALDGQGRMVFITGTAGSGKSVLLRAFARSGLLRYPDVVVLDTSCTAYAGSGPPYMPFREMLNVLLGHATTRWASGNIRDLQRSRLTDLQLPALELLASRCQDLVGPLLSAEALADRLQELNAARLITQGQADRYARAFERSSARSDVEQRDLFEHYATLLHLLCAHRPLLLAIDDLHWADANSISLLFHLGRRLEGKRILIAGAYRTAELGTAGREDRHSLAQVVYEMQRRYGDITVDLDSSSGRQFVDAYVESESNRLGEPFRQRLWQHTRGHALFTVEMVHGMQARKELLKDADDVWVDGEIDWQTLPARVEGLIAEQVNRLPRRLRDVLEAASVQGETFIAEAIAQVLGKDERELLHELTVELGKKHRLTEEVGVQRIGAQRLSQFRFRHMLFQSYLYHSLGAVERSVLHERTALKLEGICHGNVEPFAEQLAYQFQQANMPDRAATYLLYTGRRALRMAAHERSIQDLRMGLAQLEHVTLSIERDQTELELLVTLGTSIVATTGFAAAEVGEIYTRALQLCRNAGDAAVHGVVLFNLWMFHVTRSDYAEARDFAEQLMAVAKDADDAALLLEAHHAFWTMSMSAGDFTSAHAHAQQGIELYDREQHHSLTFEYGGHDPGVCCRIFAAYALWYLGYPDRAAKQVQDAVDLARAVEHAYSLCMALTLGAEVYLLRRDGKVALAYLEEAQPAADAHGFLHWLELGDIFRGWAVAELGSPQQGITQMLRGLAANRDQVGEETGLHCFGQLASAYGKAQKPEKGLALLDAALAEEDKNKLRQWHQWESELYRLQGELRLMQKGSTSPSTVDVRAVEDSFQRAVAIARQQDARLPELRAATSLSRLWLSQGRIEPAHTLLHSTYAWFTEGFDTADLVEARKLLDVLATSSSSATP